MNPLEDKLGFAPVRARLLELCHTGMGRRHVQAMQMVTSPQRVKILLLQTDDMRKALVAGLDVPAVSDIELAPILATARSVGAHISPQGFADLLKALHSLGEIASFAGANHESLPELCRLFQGMDTHADLQTEIERVVDRYGQVNDHASDLLYSLIRDIETASARIGEVMRKVLARAASEGLIEKDTTPAMRDGRLVIPVSAATRRGISGIVHDVSASGKTAYIEPAEIVEASNKLRSLEAERDHEIIRILTELTDMVRPQVESLEQSARLLGIFDFIRAKARFAIESDANMPTIEKKPEFDWYHAVHPALQMKLRSEGREVVPLNLQLNSQQRGLIISGPNAGGKSVCLKTIGTVQYMLQCGLLPTLYENSHVCVLDKILIDIGDEQSLENDLSTYSSHLRNMKQFMIKADARTLILIDEIGSGTEPTIGGALAQAILTELGRSKCFCVASTHYQNLKTFAEEQEGFVNGSMLYDRSKFQPLFQLEIGHPGSSFAVEIARSIGLPRPVIEQAEKLVGEDYINMDKYLLDIARDRRYWANKRRDIREKEIKVDRLRDKLEEQTQDFKTRKNEMLRQAKHEAKEILAGTNARIERTIREIRESQAEKERTKSVRAELEAYKQSLVEQPESATSQPAKKKSKKIAVTQPVKSAAKTTPLAEGDYVKMEGSAVTGRIISITGDKAEVAFGMIRSKTELSKLTKTKAPREGAADQTPTLTRQSSDAIRKRQLSFNTELDVRGMRADEALQAVTYFLDDATQFGSSRVRILHGTGTGALRVAIRQFLQTYPSVIHFADEDVRFGGAGITVVELG